MRGQIIRTGVVAAALALALPAAPAAAQLPEVVFVAASGTDSGSCPRATPCRTLQYAKGRHAPEGQIRCLDSGPFEGATLLVPVTIDCGDVAAIVLGTITINDVAGTRNFVLRGLRFSGAGGGSPAVPNGIHFISGYALTIDDVVVTNYAGVGVRVEPTLAARLQIANSTIQNNGGTTGTGIYVNPQGAGYASVTLDNVQLAGNPANLFVDTRASTGSSTNVVVNRSVISGGLFGIAVQAPAGTPGAGVTLTGVTINGAATAGISANGALAQIRVGTTTIAGNSTGIERANGGLVATYGNNTLIGNGVNGTFNGFPTEN